MPTIDNLSVLSQLLQGPIDALIRGIRNAILPKIVVVLRHTREKRLYIYYTRIYEMETA